MKGHQLNRFTGSDFLVLLPLLVAIVSGLGTALAS
jgi:hypothetical protein